MLVPALSNGDAIILIVAVAIPLVLLSFLGAGEVLKQIGKGPLSIEQEERPKPGSPAPPVSREVRESEIRQMLEGKAYRQAERGEEPIDVEAELARLLAPEAGPGPAGRDPGLVAEVRTMVEASNARRARMGKEPLDVDAELERRLRDLEGL